MCVMICVISDWYKFSPMLLPLPDRDSLLGHTYDNMTRHKKNYIILIINYLKIVLFFLRSLTDQISV